MILRVVPGVSWRTVKKYVGVESLHNSTSGRIIRIAASFELLHHKNVWMPIGPIVGRIEIELKLWNIVSEAQA